MTHKIETQLVGKLVFRVEEKPPEFLRAGFGRSGRYDDVVTALADLDFVKWLVLGPFATHKDAELGRNLRQVKGVQDMEVSRKARLVTRIAEVKGGYELWLCWMRLDKDDKLA